MKTAILNNANDKFEKTIRIRKTIRIIKLKCNISINKFCF